MSDCYFKMSNKKCGVLTKKACRGCSFRKTKQELEDGRRKADERILSLPYEQRVHILNKYGRSIEDEG